MISRPSVVLEKECAERWDGEVSTGATRATAATWTKTIEQGNPVKPPPKPIRWAGICGHWKELTCPSPFDMGFQTPPLPKGYRGSIHRDMPLWTFFRTVSRSPSHSSWRRTRSEETTLSPYPSKGGARVRADRAALTLLSTR